MNREDASVRFLIIGAGPAGSAAATTSSALGAEVILVEDSVVGGAAHLRDCIPSKAMAATSIRMKAIRNAADLGIVGPAAGVDLDRLADRIQVIARTISSRSVELLESQGIEIVHGRGRFVGPNLAVATVDGIERPIPFDAALVSTGSRPRVP